MLRPMDRAVASLAPAPDDALGEALHLLQLRGVYYTRSELTAPWGLALPRVPDSLMFHVVTAGSCWLEVPGAVPLRLQAGDLAVVPHGGGHRLRDDPASPVVDRFAQPHRRLGEGYELLRYGGGGAATSMVCGAVRYDHPATRRLVEALPPVIPMVESASPRLEWLRSTLHLMAAEADDPRPGGETVITRLCDVLVVLAIRAWLETAPAARTGWLGALQDPRVGPAILQLHRDPGRDWTVSSLAAEAAMSRSAFAARFRALVGESPLQYVTRWRMQLAARRLRDDGASLAEVAQESGYRSEAAFSRAFKQWTGRPPGVVRRAGASREGRP